MSFRPAARSDASSLAAISIEVWIGTYIRNGVNGFFADYALSTFTADRFEALLGDPGESVIVSENRDGIDGFVRVTRDRAAPEGVASHTEITTLYVQPRHKGRGLGKALLAEGIAIARARGATSVWLTTNSENTDAIGFYQSQGFRVVGRTHFRIGDEAYPNEILLCDLAA
ncbi:MAG: GNAT family N-acetyltransferase [Maritimibacter sp.]|nr:GNAT family N-acetyltransferase [Maritimibacter sp.]